MIRDKILKLRSEKNVTQEEFAGAVGVSRQTICRWESGENEPSANMLGTICSYFGITLDEFLENESVTKEVKLVNRAFRERKIWKISVSIAYVVLSLALIFFWGRAWHYDFVQKYADLYWSIAYGLTALLFVFHFVVVTVEWHGAKKRVLKRNGIKLACCILACLLMFGMQTPFQSVNAETYRQETVGSSFMDTNVKIEKEDHGYLVTVDVTWKTQSHWLGINHPDFESFDYLVVSWGGTQNFVCKEHHAEGTYDNGKEVNVSRRNSNGYNGYCWQFLEKESRYGSNLQKLTVTCKLETLYPIEEHEYVPIEVVYVHTYSRKVPEIMYEKDTYDLVTVHGEKMWTARYRDHLV